MIFGPGRVSAGARNERGRRVQNFLRQLTSGLLDQGDFMALAYHDRRPGSCNVFVTYVRAASAVARYLISPATSMF